MAKERILVIEDNSLEAKQILAVMETAGYAVIHAETGVTGFKLAKTQRPDLILLDIVLPDYTGDQLCQWLKQDEATRPIPLIMLTAKASIEDKVAGLRIGADDYLPKPFNEHELLARVMACLRTKMLQDELRGKNDQLESLLKEVEQKAVTDVLTGLKNRRHFSDLLDKEFSRAKRFNDALACLMLDIDHFKSINDTHGHEIGDSVLSKIGKIFQEAVRQIEVAARWGGEEFAMLFPKTGIQDCLKPATRIFESIKTHHFNGLPQDRMVTVSIGISGLPDPLITTKEELVKCADYALYRAKRAGRNRIEVSDGTALGKWDV